jgi:hypothetical protein
VLEGTYIDVPKLHQTALSRIEHGYMEACGMSYEQIWADVEGISDTLLVLVALKLTEGRRLLNGAR